MLDGILRCFLAWLCEKNTETAKNISIPFQLVQQFGTGPSFLCSVKTIKERIIMETKKRMTRKLDLLTAVEQVVELSKGSHLDAEFYKKAAHPLRYLSEKLELTKEQSVMISLFVDNCNDTSIRINDFSRHLD